jgi:hypothetical protein
MSSPDMQQLKKLQQALGVLMNLVFEMVEQEEERLYRAGLDGADRFESILREPAWVIDENIKRLEFELESESNDDGSAS